MPHQFVVSAVERRPYSPQPPTPPPRGANDSLLDDFNRQDLPQAQPADSPPMRHIILAALIFSWKTLVFPAVGLAYLTFCYICHYRIVRISDTADPVAHLSIIKAGVTSISILIVSLSLLPLSSLVSDLKSEEFFRILSTRRQGIPFESINNISTPSYGMRDGIVTLYRRHASIYFIGALFATLLALATSALAPAVLSVGTALFDGDLVALSVGAIQRNSFIDMSNFTYPRDIHITPAILDKARGARPGDIAWTELSLGLNYSFQSPIVNQTTYIVPTPAKLSLHTRARWISDVIAMRPVCEWIAADIESPGALNFSKIVLEINDFRMNFTSSGVQLVLTSILDTLDDTEPSIQPMEAFVDSQVFDLNTKEDLTNGAMVFYFAQCAAGCSKSVSPINVTITPELHPVRWTGTNGRAFDTSFLYCDPKAEIQTRHITHDGRGALTVGEKASTSQGNLHPVYTTMLLGFALYDIHFAGPMMPKNTSDLGNQVQFSMFFGNSSLASTQISMQPIEHITRSYTSILQSAMKPFVNGSAASAYVPARATRETIVFVSSPPHFIASTILYVLLTLFAVACYFRRHAAQFTFFAVASRLAGSDIPPSFAGLRDTKKDGPPAPGAAVTSFKKVRMYMEGGEVINLQNDI